MAGTNKTVASFPLRRRRQWGWWDWGNWPGCPLHFKPDAVFIHDIDPPVSVGLAGDIPYLRISTDGCLVAVTVLGVSNVLWSVVAGFEGEEASSADGGDAIGASGGVVGVNNFFVGVDEGSGLFGGCVRRHCGGFVSCSGVVRWVSRRRIGQYGKI